MSQFAGGNISQAELDAVRARWEAEKPHCRDCSVILDWKFTFGDDDEGRGGTSVYQCPKCKDLAVNP